MLTHLELTNYRAFKTANLEFKPITVLLGKNNVGKSSLLGFLSILKQTYLQLDNNYSSALRINGKYANAGDPRSLFHLGNIDEPLVVNIGFTTEKLTEMIDELTLEFQKQIARYASAVMELIIPSSNTKMRDERSSLDKLFYLGQVNIVKTRELLTNVAYNIEIQIAKKNNDDLKRLERILGPELGRRPNIGFAYKVFFGNLNKSAIATLDLLEALQNLSTDPVAEISFKLCLKEGRLVFSDLGFHLDSKILVNICFDNQILQSAKSDMINFEKIHNDLEGHILDGLFHSSRTLFNCVESIRDEPFVSPKRVIGDICQYLLKCLGEHFTDRQFSHIPPLRTKPKRYYFSDEMVDNQSVPSVVLDALISRDEVLKEVNAWFRKFDIEFSAKNEKDIYYRILLAERFPDLDLDITDLGFGVSQVLPVITFGYIVESKSILMIEQPEVHLHPKMQASLADLFDVVTRSKNSRNSKKKEVTRDKMLIVETHSEYLLTRLAFLHAEFRSGNISDTFIDPDDVAVHFIEANNDGRSSVVRRVDAPKFGTYVLPDDFIDEELDMYMATLKN